MAADSEAANGNKGHPPVSQKNEALLMVPDIYIHNISPPFFKTYIATLVPKVESYFPSYVVK